LSTLIVLRVEGEGQALSSQHTLLHASRCTCWGCTAHIELLQECMHGWHQAATGMYITLYTGHLDAVVQYSGPSCGRYGYLGVVCSGSKHVLCLQRPGVLHMYKSYTLSKYLEAWVCLVSLLPPHLGQLEPGAHPARFFEHVDKGCSGCFSVCCCVAHCVQMLHHNLHAQACLNVFQI